ncbi:MAG TPA: glycosyltransferase [Gemmatimonadaceae bacterium]|nr:glycosyltransferase [Gemmatimonadaceae bacterium]
MSVAVVAICGESHLERCLNALSHQHEAPEFDIVIAAAPTLGELGNVRQRFPDAQIRIHEGVTSPVELAAKALAGARGDVILLTEDHCVPDSEWVKSLTRTVQRNGSAVGGAVDPLDPEDMTAFDWAFYYVDFYRYQAPLTAGIADSLSVCNVAYRRSNLESLDEPWDTSFHETRIHTALARQGAPLWMEPRASVRAGRRVHRSDALRERYSFGRYYGCRRIEPPHDGSRLRLLIASPLLPLLLIARMARASARDDRRARRFLRSLPDIAALVLAWSIGEALGYLTRKAPATMEAASERGMAGPQPGD